jgi:hypothetical protein
MALKRKTPGADDAEGSEIDSLSTCQNNHDALRAQDRRRRVRHMLELKSGEFISPREVKDAATAYSALAVVRMQLKEALEGLSPLFTKEALLAVCIEVMAEDDDADGPQTKLYCHHIEDQDEAFASEVQR